VLHITKNIRIECSGKWKIDLNWKIKCLGVICYHQYKLDPSSTNSYKYTVPSQEQLYTTERLNVSTSLHQRLKHHE
jgi:hypothetical protein